MRFEKGSILLSQDYRKNIIEQDGVFYQLDYLSPDQKGSKGGNSSVFKLTDPNDDIEYAIKFSKFPRIPKHNQRNRRFQHEIDALVKARDNGFENVVEIYFDGIHRVEENSFSYYVMEKADSDLTSYMKQNRVPNNQKYVLCYEIIKGINQLHSIDIFHRDIKPDNIFFVGNTWKIGDLGLRGDRNKYPVIDRPNEKIGPYGWLSPEVMNKVLCEGTLMERIHDCVIDAFSDIFQLGKLVWFIFNGNVPIGQIKLSDFLLNKADVFDLIMKMLQYNKKDRGKLADYEEAFELYAN